jgi:hypothetical protein
MAAQGIVAGIRQGCEFLREGKAQIGEVKKAIGEVKAFIGEARGIWAEFQSLWALVSGLFGAKKPKQVNDINVADITKSSTPKSVAAVDTTSKPADKTEKQRHTAEPELSYEEYQAQAIHQICEQLKSFFEIKRQLAEHCHKLEEESKTTTDIESAALDRIQIEMQMEQMTVQIREAMIYTPKEIGLQSIYSRFLEMYDQILEERAFDRELKAKQARDEAWQREYRNDLLKAKLGYAIVVAIAALWMTGLYSVL